MTQSPIDQLVVLDIGGVVYQEPVFQPIFDAVAARSDLTVQELRERFYKPLFRPLMRGLIDETAFWGAFLDGAGVAKGAMPLAYWRDVARRPPAILPGARNAIVELSRQGPLWVLSNQFAPWLSDCLCRDGFDCYFAEILITSDLGVAKPDRACFDALLDRWSGSACSVFFVDDKEENRVAAGELGIATCPIQKNGEAAPWFRAAQTFRTAVTCDAGSGPA